MSNEIFVQIIEQIFGLVVATALVFWNEIVQWIGISLLVWIQNDLGPIIAEESVNLAFAVLGQVAVAMYSAIKEAWDALRRFLVEANAEFEKSSSSSSQWVRRLTSTMIRVLDSGQPVIVKREVEEEVDWDSLPPELRAAWLQSSQKNYKVDFVGVRDKEMQVMSMTH